MNNKLLAAAGLAASAVFAAPAFSEDEVLEMRPYASAMASYVFEQDDRDELLGVGSDIVEDGMGFQLGAGMAVNRFLGLELSGFSHHFSKGSDGVNSMREYGGKLDGLFFYSRKPSFSPYFGVGLGGVKTHARGTGESSTDPFADVGLGFMSYLGAGARVALRADARYRQIFFDEDALGGVDQDDVGEPILNIGLVIPFGSKTAAAPAETVAACADADGDGVCDTADLCPETPKGVAVDAKGCPPDAGKGPNQKFEDVHFAFDRAELTDYSKALLDGAAGVIGDLSKKYPDLKVDIGGHTDSTGTDGYNQGLSERRANTVKTYLQTKGVESERMSTQAYGESKPKATNETDEGQALNRRAEVSTREK